MRIKIATRALGALLIAGVALLTACGQATGGAPVPTATATTALPTVTPTLTPALTATPTIAPTAAICQPDTYGIYAQQTGYVTTLSDAPFSAPPATKHGIGSTGNNGSVTQGGESGVCTIGSFATISAYYDGLLPALGWQFSGTANHARPLLPRLHARESLVERVGHLRLV